LLYFVQRRPADGCALGQDGGGYAAPAPGITNVLTQLAKGAGHRYGRLSGDYVFHNVH
jgi:hypothetical protein